MTYGPGQVGSFGSGPKVRALAKVILRSLLFTNVKLLLDECYLFVSVYLYPCMGCCGLDIQHV